MKAICYSETVMTGDMPLPRICIYADSAISRDVMPLFIPDISESWKVKICLAARVHRLGKNILPKFVHRYVDAVGAVAILQPTDDNLEKSGVMRILDGAVTTGTWIERNIGADDALTVDTNGESRLFRPAELGIAEAVSLISRYATLKTGDFIIFESTAAGLPLSRNDIIDVTIDSRAALHLKVK